MVVENSLELVDDLIDIFETSSMLGAAWDCISDDGKSKIRQQFLTVIKKHVVED